MRNRVSKRLVKFQYSFRLHGHEEVWPAGNYTIETEEVPMRPPLRGFKTICTTMIIHPSSRSGKASRFIEVNPLELETAISNDRGKPDPEEFKRLADEPSTPAKED